MWSFLIKKKKFTNENNTQFFCLLYREITKNNRIKKENGMNTHVSQATHSMQENACVCVLCGSKSVNISLFNFSNFNLSELIFLTN